jgi:hypothetical protein
MKVKITAKVGGMSSNRGDLRPEVEEQRPGQA